MIITLIVIAIFVLGIVSFTIKGKFSSYKIITTLEAIGILGTVVGGIIGLAITCMLVDNVVNLNINYQNTLHKREMLEYRIGHVSENITGNEMLYNDIVEFNNELRSQKKWANNLWTNWFNNKYIADLDYIELE